jgi:hypothetical protein
MYNEAGLANVKELTDFVAQWIRGHRIDHGERGQANG